MRWLQQMPRRWRAVLALVLVMPGPTVGVLLSMWWAPGPIGQGVWVFAKLWTLALPAVWFKWVDGGDWGVRVPGRGGLAAGAATGAAMAGVVGLAWWWARGWIDLEPVRAVLVAAGLNTPARVVGAAVFWVLVNPVIEEYIWRWFVFRQWLVALGDERAQRPDAVVTAVALSSAAFSAYHLLAVLAYFPLWLAGAITLGIFLAASIWQWLFVRFGSTWPAILSHAVAGAAVFVIGWWIMA